MVHIALTQGELQREIRTAPPKYGELVTPSIVKRRFDELDTFSLPFGYLYAVRPIMGCDLGRYLFWCVGTS